MVFHWQNVSHLTWVPNKKISCRILYRGNELYCTHPITQIYYSSTLRGYHHFNYNIDWKIIIKKFMIGSIYMRFETHSTLKVSYKTERWCTVNRSNRKRLNSCPCYSTFIITWHEMGSKRNVGSPFYKEKV